METDEALPLHIPVSLLALSLQVDAIGEALVQQVGYS
jgi:hypothetical protein